MLLLVDDEDSIRTMMIDVLELLGHTVEVCGDGESAVLHYRDSWQETDVVILDLSLPTMSGVEVYNNMAKVNPNLRVVFISGYDMKKEVQPLLNVGHRVFLQKPFTIHEMRDAIVQVTECDCISG